MCLINGALLFQSCWRIFLRLCVGPSKRGLKLTKATLWIFLILNKQVLFLASVLCRAPDYCFDEIFCKRCSIYILFRWLNGYFLVTFMTAVLVQRKYLSFLLSNLEFSFGLRKICNQQVNNFTSECFISDDNTEQFFYMFKL